MTASTSRAIAPHASTSTSGRSASKTRSSSGRSSCCTASHQERLGGLGRDRGVTAVRVCADRLAELLVQGGAPDEDDVVVTDALLVQCVDDDLHVGHGRREEGGHPEDVRLVLLECLQVVLDGVVDAEVVDLEPRAFEHHRDE